MTLKHVRLVMAESLSKEIRKKHGLKDKGMIAIEIRTIDDINKYFLESGKFTER